MKRILDLIGAGLLLMALLPLMSIIALAVLLVEGRPVIYRQQRAGRDGQAFTMFKFRTMQTGTPPHLPDRPVAKQPHDPRVTRLGQFLRRSSLDELPQLLNVLRGEMSLVGPRPLPLEDLQQPGWLTRVSPEERSRRLDWLTRRHQALPGLTGLWQISPNPAEDFENWMRCDLAYVAAPSFTRDLLILLHTPASALRGRQQAGGVIPPPHPTDHPSSTTAPGP